MMNQNKIKNKFINKTLIKKFKIGQIFQLIQIRLKKIKNKSFIITIKLIILTIKKKMMKVWY